MRPTAPLGEHATSPPRKLTAAGADRRPSLSAIQQPTSFFLAREEDVFGPATTLKTGLQSENVDLSAPTGSTSKSPAESGGAGVESEGRSASQADSTYGVQSLEDALGQAFPGDAKEEAEGSLVGLAGLLKRKRRTPSQSEAEKHILSAAATAATADETSRSRYTSPQTRDSSHVRKLSRSNNVSQPLTPLQLESPLPLPSTPKSGSFRSLRLSDEDDDDVESQAITSGGEEYESDGGRARSVAGARTSNAPELVMPSLAMPARPPFTQKGKQMGRLKIAVAGAGGVGKTSLIRAIVRECEHIVYLDPTTAPTPNVQQLQSSRTNKRATSSQPYVTEIQASTKAYPSWWSDLEEDRVLRRRKSFGETVLERNISFIDSPGFDGKKGVQGQDNALLQYLETLFQKNAGIIELGSSDLLGVLSGAGGVQVDVVLYVCQSNETLSENDFDCMHKLSKYASVVPIIPKADLLPQPELTKRRDAMLPDLNRCGVNPSLLLRSKDQNGQMDEDIEKSKNNPSPHAIETSPVQAPFLVSCLPGSDSGEMDASLLMSPSYSPPLVLSELQPLVSMLFEPDTMIKLRHISARKFLAWRKQYGKGTSMLADSTSISSAGTALGVRDHLALVRSSPQRRTTSPAFSGQALAVRNAGHAATTSPFNLSSSAGIGQGLPEFSRARIRDHIMREERLAQVQLARWASDLQRGIRRERKEFAQLIEGERAKWLLERVGEEAAFGNLGIMGQEDASAWALEGRRSSRASRRSKRASASLGGGRQGLVLPSWAQISRSTSAADRRGLSGMDCQDPLYLCGLGDALGRTAGVVLKVLGGGVIVGAVWVAVCRAWGLEEKWWVGLW